MSVTTECSQQLNISTLALAYSVTDNYRLYAGAFYFVSPTKGNEMETPEEKLKSCPFCAGDVGRSDTLCGAAQGKWWCRNQDYFIRTPDPLAQKVEFVFEHKVSGETITVSLSVEEIKNDMEDILRDKLTCDCQPIGETNVIECNCCDYFDEFEIQEKR